MILNTGDVPNLYASDEKAEIIEKMQTAARNEVKIYRIAIRNIRTFESRYLHCTCRINTVQL